MQMICLWTAILGSPVLRGVNTCLRQSGYIALPETLCAINVLVNAYFSIHHVSSIGVQRDYRVVTQCRVGLPQSYKVLRESLCPP